MTARKAYNQAPQCWPTEAGLQRALNPARTSFSLATGKALTKGRAKKKLSFPQLHTTLSPHSRKAAQIPSLWWAGKASYECQQLSLPFNEHLLCAKTQAGLWGMQDQPDGISFLHHVSNVVYV